MTTGNAKRGDVFLVIQIVVCIVGLVILADATRITLSTTYYTGDIIISSEAQKADIIAIMDSDYVKGPLGIGSKPYSISGVDSGQEILHYAFYSKNAELPFSKGQ